MRIFTPQLLILQPKMLVQLDQYTQYSPFLCACSSFNGTDVVNVDFDEVKLGNYLAFLRGEDFSLDEEDAEFFNYMGHSNINGYPLDYWKLKLKQYWIRDNFHRLQLYKNPLYGLVKVPIVRHITIPLKLDPSHTMIAGGAVLFMTGVSSDFDDIDLFSVNKDKSMELFKVYVDSLDKSSRWPRLSTGPHTFNITADCQISHGGKEQSSCLWVSHSLIRKVYSCPSEIVHNFDIDCCQFILVGDELYGTELAVRAIDYRYQYPDTKFFSSTYIQRLAKYHQRGIKLKMPLLSVTDLVFKEHRYLSSMKDHYFHLKVDNSVVSLMCYISFYDIVEPRLIEMLMRQGDNQPHDYDYPLFQDISWSASWIQVSWHDEPLAPLIQLYKECPILSSTFKELLP